MIKQIMIYIYVVILCGVMWYPGFLLGTNMIRAVSQRKLYFSDILMCMIPGINLAVARRELVGSAKIVWFAIIQLLVVSVLKLVVFYGFNNSFGVLLSLVFTYAFIASFIIFWSVQAYVLWDMCNVIGFGFLTKILGIFVPPLAYWNIGRNCYAMIRSTMEEIESMNAEAATAEELY